MKLTKKDSYLEEVVYMTLLKSKEFLDISDSDFDCLTRLIMGFPFAKSDSLKQRFIIADSIIKGYAIGKINNLKDENTITNHKR